MACSSSLKACIHRPFANNDGNMPLFWPSGAWLHTHASQEPDHRAPICEGRLKQVQADKSSQSDPVRTVEPSEQDAQEHNDSGNQT
jgi:hypothetical protein